MKEELKPCPFCGGKAQIVYHEVFIDLCAIKCTNEECAYLFSTDYVDADTWENDLIDFWNTKKKKK